MVRPTYEELEQRLAKAEAELAAARQQQQQQREHTQAVQPTAVEDANARLASIIERMADGFVSFDRQWRYTQVNPAAAMMFGRRAEKLLGQSL